MVCGDESKMRYDDEIDPDELNEKLISKKHRDYRCLANAKLSNVQDEKQNLIRDKKLSHVENELRDLELSLHLVTAKPRLVADAQQLAVIQQQLEHYEHLNRQINNVETQLAMFTSQLKRLQCEKDRLSANTVSDNEYARNIKQAAENVRRLENRVYGMNGRVSALLERNRQLRAIAKHVIRERMTFGRLFAQLIDRLGERKKQLVDMVDQVVYALDGGADLCKRIVMVEKKATEDLHFHRVEMTELMQSVYVNDQKYAFFAGKGRHNALRDLNANECRRRELFRRTQRENIEKFRRVLHATGEITNEADYVDTMNSFKKYERDFFAYYSYLNELNVHMANVTTVSRHPSKGESQEKSTNELLQQSQRRLDAERRRSAEKEETLNEMQVQINGYFDRIKQVFDALNCYKKPQFARMQAATVQLGNYQSFLMAIETCLKEVLSGVYYAERLHHPDTYIVRDVEVNQTEPYERNALEHLIPQCAECVATESIQIGRKLAMPVDSGQLLRSIKKSRPQEIQHRLHHINACHIPRCHMLYVKHSQNG